MAEKLGGSSPLTRGKHAVSATILQVRGLIPAHAGKTASHRAARRRRAAHPRSRGENVSCGFARSIMSGSSPLTRGKLRASWDTRPPWGLIPAHAGKTKDPYVSCVIGPAHPRSRGENAGINAFGVYAVGSSPLTRGKPTCRTVALPSHGLIPAHAGKTFAFGEDRRRCRAHPRSRGENSTDCLYICSYCGSSPLTRGKPHPIHW